MRHILSLFASQYHARELTYSGETESQPQVYKSYTGREEKKTKYGQARADAYREMSPQVRTTLDNKIAEQLRIIRSEQSLFNRATWNRANQQMPNPQVQPKGGQPQPMSGVTYDFDRAPSQQQRNVQWGSTPDAMLLSYTSNVQDIYNFMHPGMKFRPRKRNLQKRTSVLDEIEGSTSKGNSTVSQTAEFQVYLNAYRTVQANISNLIFPFFDTVINGTNNSLIYDIVWSVYSDLTNSGPQIIGPFSYGRHCFDWMEEAYLNSTRNSTSSHTSSNSSANGTDVKDPVYQQMLATHYQLIEIYSYVWSNASAIANQTGLLRDLVIFQKYLAPADPSIMSQDWTSAQTNFDNSYFTAYNKTH